MQRRKFDDMIMMHPFQVEARYCAQLQPCPFCGSTNLALYMSRIPHVTCLGCGADGPGFDQRDGLDEDAMFKAVRFWNSREKPA